MKIIFPGQIKIQSSQNVHQQIESPVSLLQSIPFCFHVVSFFQHHKKLKINQKFFHNHPFHIASKERREHVPSVCGEVAENL